ncbi:hypothetical protein KAF39_05075 [Microbacterium sp. BLY]|nr:hypothetical protein [Microbacterium sp. BLY]
MDVIALIVAGLSLCVSFVGTILSNRRSKDALALAQRAAIDARWSALQEAVQRLIGFDPTADPIEERLINLRIAMVALVDELPDWDGLDTWLDAERALGATFGRQVMTAARPGDDVEQRVRNLEPLMTWAQALSSNLRFLRSKGYVPKTLQQLTDHVTALIREVHEKNGWDLPPSVNPRIGKLE